MAKGGAGRVFEARLERHGSVVCRLQPSAIVCCRAISADDDLPRRVKIAHHPVTAFFTADWASCETEFPELNHAVGDAECCRARDDDRWVRNRAAVVGVELRID